jgi:hypothetical protein
MGRCRQVGTAFAKRRQSLSKAASLLQRGNELSPGVVSDSHETKIYTADIRRQER